MGEVDEGTTVRVDGADGDGKDGRVVHVDGEAFDHVILATGFSTAPGRTPLYQQVEAEFALQTVQTPCGSSRFPLLDENLSWAEGADLYVVGANAVLELGPGALNLMGAMRGAKIVAEALRDVMWSSEHNRDAEMATNEPVLEAQPRRRRPRGAPRVRRQRRRQRRRPPLLPRRRRRRRGARAHRVRQPRVGAEAEAADEGGDARGEGGEGEEEAEAGAAGEPP